jgi:hypothetical protein
VAHFLSGGSSHASITRPDQILPFEEVIDFVLPAFNADITDRIAGTAPHRQRHQPPFQGGIDISG